MNNKKIFCIFFFTLFFLLACTTPKQEIVYEKTIESSQASPSFSGYCCMDNELHVGSYQITACEGDEKNLENIPIDTKQSCKEMTHKKNYRYTTFYQTTPTFAIVCTEGKQQCTLSDEAFFHANFKGYILGMEALKKATGEIMPKKKIEFHLAQDDDCFQKGYEASIAGGYTYEKFTPYYVRIICNTPYKWYVELKGTVNERTIARHETLASQTLTIHEPIHIIFSDYKQKKAAAPSYVLQESFAKHVSLQEVGIIKNYSGWIASSSLNLTNLPNETSPWHDDFFVYSLHQRFGFNETHMKQFFQEYAKKENDKTPGNQKVKDILDTLLGTNTQKSFEDVGVVVR